MTENVQPRGNAIEQSAATNTDEAAFPAPNLQGSSIMSLMMSIPLILVGGLCLLYYGFHDAKPLVVMAGVACVGLAVLCFMLQDRWLNGTSSSSAASSCSHVQSSANVSTEHDK